MDVKHDHYPNGLTVMELIAVLYRLDPSAKIRFTKNDSLVADRLLIKQVDVTAQDTGGHGIFTIYEPDRLAPTYGKFDGNKRKHK